MIKKIFAPALAAGVIAGVLISGLQAVTTTPLIHAAETYETAAAPAAPQPAVFQAGDARILLAHSGAEHDHDGGPWAPEDGLERTAFTAMANILIGCGYALLLTAGFALAGRSVDARRGLVWGAAGFAAFTLAPAAGLPPELPGTLAAELGARQAWWVFAAVATAAGLWLTVFARPGALKWPMTLGGLLLIAAPHLIGAPHPESLGGTLVPAELSAHYAALSIAVGAVFWALIGWMSGHFWARIEAEEQQGAGGLAAGTR